MAGQAVKKGPQGPHHPGAHEFLEALYDLKSDIAETTDVSAKHPDVVARLEKVAEAARTALGDKLTRREGKEVRQPGQLSN